MGNKMLREEAAMPGTHVFRCWITGRLRVTDSREKPEKPQSREMGLPWHSLPVSE